VVDLKVEILIPKYYNPDKFTNKRRKIEGIKLADTFDEIYDEFDGCTVDYSPLIGGWKDPKTGKQIKDENIAYWVVCANTKKNLRFFGSLKKKLKKVLSKTI
jgi:hypothetical protein